MLYVNYISINNNNNKSGQKECFMNEQMSERTAAQSRSSLPDHMDPVHPTPAHPARFSLTPIS